MPTLPTREAPNCAASATSPLRYPGGKSWFAPLLRPLLDRHPPRTPETRFTEAFAGGAGITCQLLLRPGERHAHLNELDDEVRTLWQVIFSPRAEALAQAIRTAGATRQDLSAHLDGPVQGEVHAALRTVIRNRLNYGGIFGAKSGQSRAPAGQDRPPRWYPDTLAARVLSLSRCQERAHVTGHDALDLLARLKDHPGVIFIDPPYTATPHSAGHLLYRHAALDHHALIRTAAALRGPWVMTHEDHPVIEDAARTAGLDLVRLHMHSNGGPGRTELAIGRDLSWLAPQPRLLSA